MMMLLTLCRLPTADCRLPTADCRLPTADGEGRVRVLPNLLVTEL
jgi:hypothetical protein